MEYEETNEIKEPEINASAETAEPAEAGHTEEFVPEEPKEETVYSEPVAEQPVPKTAENNPPVYESPSFYSTVPVYTQAPEKKKKKGKNFWIAATAVLAAICIMTSSFAIGAVFGRANAPAAAPTVAQTAKTVTVSTPDYVPTSQNTAEGRLDVAGVAEKVNPSVVVILTSSDQGGSLGTGVIFTDDGYIITCAHVIDDANKVSVYLYGDDKTAYDAEVIGFDTYSDIGVIKVNLNGLPAAEFGESHKLVPGEQVVAIGTPYERNLAYTVTSGYVSSRRDNYKLEDLNLTLDLIQHSATINPGNSGGPLLNMYGQVVGINSVKIMMGEFETFEDIGFAIQTEAALPIVEQIINEGSVQRPQIGIKGATDEMIGGVYVSEILEGGGAEKADIQVGDIITKLNGERVKSIDELITKLGKFKAGDEVELTLLRDVDVVITKVILQEPAKG
jgi:serine protease Do